MLTHDGDLSGGETALRRGVAAARAGLRPVAAAQFERAAENLPDDPNVWLWLAWAANSPDNTIRCLERLLELSPGHELALAGMTWARGLVHDKTPATVGIPASMTVAEPPVPIVPMAEPAASDQETCAANVDSVTEVEVANETPTESASEAMSDLRSDTAEETRPIADSLELPEESSNESIAQELNDSPPLEATSRPWNDPVPLDSKSSTDSNAWPSLVPPPLPSPFATPLSIAEVSGPEEREQIEPPSRFHGLFAANPVAPSDVRTNDTGLSQEAHTDVETLTQSFNPPPPDISTDARPLVMVVDDSPTVRKLVSLTLERRGYRVISAFDGVAAIKELGSCRPDLILLDINMPRLDGYRLCKLIKKHEATQTIPVVMLSGKDGMFDKLRGRLVGCSDYITKPFEADALTHKVAKYLTSASSSL